MTPNTTCLAGGEGMTTEKLLEKRKKTVDEVHAFWKKAYKREKKPLQGLIASIGPAPPWKEARKDRLKIDEEAFEKALRSYAKNASHFELEREALLKETKEWFQALSLPKELTDFFERFSFLKVIDFGYFRFEPVNSMILDILDEPQLIHAGLLRIGSNDCGDPLFVDLVDFTLRMGNHENKSEGDPRALFDNFGLDIGSAFLQSVSGDAAEG